jgi:hypothetical protein
MPAGVKLAGNDSLKRKLAKLAVGVQGAELENALVEGGVLIQNSAKRFAPFREGKLRKSIHIPGHEDRASDYDGNYERGKKTLAGKEGSGPNISITVGTDIIYGAQKEYGGTITAKNAPRLVWRDYDGKWHSAFSVYQNPQPFMRPAVDENLGPFYRAVAGALSKAIKKAAS